MFDPSDPAGAVAGLVRQMFRECAAQHGIVIHGDGPLYVNGDGLVVNLANLVDECARTNPDAAADIVRHFVSSLVRHVALDPNPSMSTDVARASLRLRLAEDTHIDGVPVLDSLPPIYGWDEPAMVSRPAFPGTRWLLYVRRSDASQNVRRVDLDEWGMDPEEAFAVARANVNSERVGRKMRLTFGWDCDGPSTFHHTNALHPERIEQSGKHGWYVGIPTRSTVLVGRARTNEASVEHLCQLIVATRTLWTNEPHPLCRHNWYIPPEGPGEFGCDAEPILLVDDGTPDNPEPQFTPRFGPRLHALWGEYPPPRPAPKLIL